MGFKVILWITPFVNTDSDNFKFLEQNEYLVMKKNSSEAALLSWWGGVAGLIDLTNPNANKWYTETLLKLKEEYGVDGFKIDGGDAKFQPELEISRWYDYQGASGYTDLLLSSVEAAVPGMCETRTAWISQKRSVVWRQGGKDTHWGENNGLKALVNYGIYMAMTFSFPIWLAAECIRYVRTIPQ